MELWRSCWVEKPGPQAAELVLLHGRLPPTDGSPVLTSRSPAQGTISVGVDATDLFDRYDEEYEDVSGSGFPQIEINKMHISQSIEVKHRNVL